MPTTISASLRLALVFLLPLGLFGCTITETVENFLSSTSPGDYTQDGLPKAEQRVNLFVALNLDNLKMDLARGKGEYLTSLGTLLQIAPQRETEFFALAQQRYPSLAQEDRTAVSRTLIALSHDLRAIPRTTE
ncbi:MAG: DUF3015 family protein [Nitrospiraceae bacterium]